MFKTLSRKTVYQNRWMKLHEDIIERPGGIEGLFGVVEKPDFSAIIAVDNGHIHLVEQYRYPIGQRSLELPMGGWPEQPDADPLALARGELQEETGYVAEHIEQIGYHHVDNGGGTMGCNVFFATGLTFSGRNPDPEEADLEPMTLPLTEFERRIKDGEILDACTIACYGLAKLKGLV
ncbi:NUDIX domain-containing protein [Reinekea blandensis]|uniref:GDP-mannose pyrophosphatase n=1 Tax=Reinekea blandensis MED297 TaxID=314283 RepID=A4BGV3_9GAMM|nr:NUDIX hydrolase [Reinekea blandensis]EAR08599.1 hypothetical protein MED297_02805 [Reinekea sp. MED297] [Reinekea blandensis MED297]